MCARPSSAPISLPPTDVIDQYRLLGLKILVAGWRSPAYPTATVTESIAGYAVIKAFGREREQLRIVERNWQRYRDDIQGAQFLSLVPPE